MYLTSDYSSRAAGPTSTSDVRYRALLRAQIIKLLESGAFTNALNANAGLTTTTITASGLITASGGIISSSKNNC